MAPILSNPIKGLEGKSWIESVTERGIGGKYSSSLPGVGVIGVTDVIGEVGVIVVFDDIGGCVPVKFIIVPIWMPWP